jgi:hypothetical protein
VLFAFYFVMSLLLLYLTVLVEQQFIVAGICP